MMKQNTYFPIVLYTASRVVDEGVSWNGLLVAKWFAGNITHRWRKSMFVNLQTAPMNRFSLKQFVILRQLDTNISFKWAESQLNAIKPLKINTTIDELSTNASVMIIRTRENNSNL